MSDGLETLSKGRLIKLGGKEYCVAELTVGDMAEFEVRAKSNIKKEQRQQLEQAKEFYAPDTVPIEVFKTIVKPPTREQIDAETATLDGISFLLYRALKKNSAEITEESARDLIKIKDIPLLMKTMGLEAEDEGKNGGGPVTSL